jgi:hypothetical protein
MHLGTTLFYKIHSDGSADDEFEKDGYRYPSDFSRGSP